MDDRTIAWMLAGGTRNDPPDARERGHVGALREANATRAAETRLTRPRRQRNLTAILDRLVRRPALATTDGVALDCCMA
jgi:hypothetical protein